MHNGPPTEPIRILRLADWCSVPDLETAWDDLLHRAGGGSLFQTLPWHVCWWEAFGAAHELLVLLAYAGTRLVGIAPTMIARAAECAGKGRRVHFLGSTNHASDYCDFIIDPECPEALDALLEQVRVLGAPFHRIDLAHLPGRSPNTQRLVTHFRRGNLRTRVEVQQVAPTRLLGDAAADRKAANKASLKRHTRHFRDAGELRFRRAESEAEILRYLPVFFEQHTARWAATDTPSQFIDPDQRAFFRQLVQRLFCKGWLKFDIVLFDGAPLAFHFGFEYRRRFIWYKPTFDMRFAARSPGEVLLKHLLDDAIDRGLEEFDFTIGAEPFKLRFANQIRCIERLIVFRSLSDYWSHGAVCALRRLLGRDPASRARQRAPAGSRDLTSAAALPHNR